MRKIKEKTISKKGEGVLRLLKIRKSKIYSTRNQLEFPGVNSISSNNRCYDHFLEKPIDQKNKLFNSYFILHLKASTTKSSNPSSNTNTPRSPTRRQQQQQQGSKQNPNHYLLDLNSIPFVVGQVE